MSSNAGAGSLNRVWLVRWKQLGNAVSDVMERLL